MEKRLLVKVVIKDAFSPFPDYRPERTKPSQERIPVAARMTRMRLYRGKLLELANRLDVQREQADSQVQRNLEQHSASVSRRVERFGYDTDDTYAVHP